MDFSALVGMPFRAASAMRRARVFHPDGVVFRGEVRRVAPDGHGLPLQSGDVLARLSKGIGLPFGLPDIGGLAFRRFGRSPDEQDWDVLLAGSGSGIVGRMIPWPARSWGTTEFSTLMPLQYDGRSWWLRAVATESPTGAMNVENARDALFSNRMEFRIDQACGPDDFVPLAYLRPTGPSGISDAQVGFDSVRNSHPQVRPAPEWLRAVRQSAYRNSREGRPTDALPRPTPPRPF